MPSTNAAVREIQGIGMRMKSAVEKFMKDNGYAKRLEGYSWDFKLVDSREVNAFCMPGGNVVFYTGILPLTMDDDGAAVVMGHEIAHAIADHGNERMSQQLAIQLGGMSLAVAMAQKPQQTQDIFNTVYGVSSALGILAYSRQHELEAHKLGLIIMGMAGYNPERAVSFWEEMSNHGGVKPPEFLSTHPSDQHRITKIREFLPEAMKYYKPGQGSPSNPSAPKIPPAPANPKKLGIKVK
jgi:predicted Zn-dependent protease